MPNEQSVTGVEQTLPPGSPTAAPHPEEMKGTITFSLGKWASVTATGRATPAGLVSAALLICTVLIPVAIFARKR